MDLRQDSSHSGVGSNCLENEGAAVAQNMQEMVFNSQEGFLHCWVPLDPVGWEFGGGRSPGYNVLAGVAYTAACLSSPVRSNHSVAASLSSLYPGCLSLVFHLVWLSMTGLQVAGTEWWTMGKLRGRLIQWVLVHLPGLGSLVCCLVKRCPLPVARMGSPTRAGPPLSLLHHKTGWQNVLLIMVKSFKSILNLNI